MKKQSMALFLSTITIIHLILISSLFTTINGSDHFSIHESTIDDIQHAFGQKKLTSRQLVDLYLHQIRTLNPLLRAVLEVNPDVWKQAESADRERERNQGRRFLGGLHGVPVLLKDSISTKGKMNTTAGSYALLGAVAAREAFVVAKLRQAGAVILGKASQTEWYGVRSLGMPRNWCARGGYAMNPYSKDGNTCGSSCGSAIAVAANMVAVSLGSETDGSIICPADRNSAVGIKPTVGLTSRAGVIPISTRQDTIGPICRTVKDAVYVLDAIVGFDPRDPKTREGTKHIPVDGYKKFLNKNGLKGKKLGILRNPILTSNYTSSEIQIFERHLTTIRQRGATLLDNLKIPNIDLILNPFASGEVEVFLVEFKIEVNKYLRELIKSSVRSLSDVIAFNLMNYKLEKMKEYGQKDFITAENSTGIGEREMKLIKKLVELSEGFEKAMEENGLDAIVTIGTNVSPLLAIGGYPGISVPAGYGINGMPFGISFGGLRWTDPKLIEIAYAFEQATLVRRPPVL